MHREVAGLTLLGPCLVYTCHAQSASNTTSRTRFAKHGSSDLEMPALPGLPDFALLLAIEPSLQQSRSQQAQLEGKCLMAVLDKGKGSST